VAVASQAQELLVKLGPFAGLSNESVARIPPGKAFDVLNWAPQRVYGAFKPVRGRGPLGQFGGPLIGSGPALALGKFKRVYPFGAMYYIQQVDPVTGGTLIAFTVQNGAWDQIALPNIGVLQPPSPLPGSFELFDAWIFFANPDPQGQAFKFDVSGNATEWQIRQGIGMIPVSTPPGLITAQNVYYRFTFSNAVQESTPSANPIGPFNLTAQNVVLDIGTSSDPQTTTINLYRIDVYNTQWLFVGSVPNQSGYGGAAPGFARIADSTPDPQVSGQTLVEHRDIPAPFLAIAAHKNRMWGFGHPLWHEGSTTHPSGYSDLWYSNEGEPWGFDNTNQVIQINANQHGDIAVEIKSVGGVLVCLKTRSSWMLYGDSPNDFQPPQEIGRGIGCVSKAGVIQAEGVLWWPSNQGIFQFDGNLEKISADIKAFLDTLTPQDWQACAAYFNDGMPWWSFPTKQVAYGYEPRQKVWTRSDKWATLFVFDTEGIELRPNAIDTVLGVQTPPSGKSELVAWQFGFADPFSTLPGSVSVATFTSGMWLSPKGGYYRFTTLVVRGQGPQFALPHLPPVVVLTVNPGTSTEVKYPNQVIFNRNPFWEWELPPEAQGMAAQIQIQVGYTADFEIFEVELYGVRVRELANADSM
jgi:hypothetical protein